MRRKNQISSPFLKQALGKDDSGLAPSRNLSFAPRKKEGETKKNRHFAVTVLQIAAVVLLALLLVRLFGTHLTVSGVSMDPTLSDGDRVLIDRMTGPRLSPKREDMIAFVPTASAGEISIKRVVAVPGDTVSISSGVLYVNGETEHSLSSLPRILDAGLASETLTLGPDEYFVLGDNRNNSQDSRYASVGMISKKQMIGKVWIAIGPGHLGLVR